MILINDCSTLKITTNIRSTLQYTPIKRVVFDSSHYDGGTSAAICMCISEKENFKLFFNNNIFILFYSSMEIVPMGVWRVTSQPLQPLWPHPWQGWGATPRVATRRPPP